MFTYNVVENVVCNSCLEAHEKCICLVVPGITNNIITCICSECLETWLAALNPMHYVDGGVVTRNLVNDWHFNAG